MLLDILMKIARFIGDHSPVFPHPDDVRKYIERERNRERCGTCGQVIRPLVSNIEW